MKLKVNFERKIPTFNLSEAFIEAVVILPEQRFKAFSRGLLKDEDFIKDHKESMYMDEKGVRHSLLILGDQSDDGFLVESQGYDYARYVAWLPRIKPYFNQQMLQLAEALIREGCMHTESGNWITDFDEIKDQYGITIKNGNGIGEQVLNILSCADEMAEVEMTEDGFDMTFYLDFCSNIVQEDTEMSMQHI
jgi:hypothetical protein